MKNRKALIAVLLVIAMLIVSAFQIPEPPIDPGGTFYKAVTYFVSLLLGALGGSSLFQLLKIKIWGEDPPDNKIVDLSIHAIIFVLSCILGLAELALAGWFGLFDFEWSMALEVGAYIYTFSQFWYAGLLKPRS